jgi:hypothetical protein
MSAPVSLWWSRALTSNRTSAIGKLKFNEIKIIHKYQKTIQEDD